MILLRYLIVLFSLLITAISSAQELTIKDKISQQSIPNAKVYSIRPKVQKIADINGRFRLEPFVGCDSIVISYPEYQDRVFSYDELRTMRDVELSDEPLTFNDIVVSVNRWDGDHVEVPGKVSKLDMRKAELLAPQTSADLLESSGYVFVQKSQLAGGSPQLRGFGTNRVLITVDGVRMNNAIFRAGNLQNVISIDANALESVEVLFGPGSVIYGSDAIGGVMDFRTKRAQFAPDSSKTLMRTNAFSRYSSASNEVAVHADVNVGRKKWASLTSLTFSRYGDLRAGKNGDSSFLRPTYQTQINGVDTTVVNEDPRLQVHSGYNQINVLQNIRYEHSKNLEFEYVFNFSATSDAPRYDRLTLDANEDGQLDYAEWYYGPQTWMMHKFEMDHSRKTGVYSDFRLTAAYQNYKESRNDRKRGGSTIRRNFEEVNAFSLNLDFDKRIDSTINIYYGLEGVFNLVGSNGYRENITTGDQTIINSRYPDGSTWQTYGAYISSKYRFAKSWVLNAGARYTFYRVAADFDTTLFPSPVTSTVNMNGSLNGNLGLVYNPNDHFQLYLNGATGFRAPNIDDIGKIFDSEPGAVVVPNVDLKPEYAYNGELGFVWGIFGKVKLDAAVYYTYLQNALARFNYTFNGQDSILYDGVMSRVQAIQNASDAKVYGIQGGIEVVIVRGLTLMSSISYQKGEEFNNDSLKYFPKSHVAPMFGRTSLEYKTRRFRFDAYAAYQARMDYEDLPLNDRSDFVYATDENGLPYTPAWFTLNFKAAFFFNKHLSMTAGVENITNQLYRTAGSGISASGRNFLVSVKATF